MSIHFGADYYPEHWPRERWEQDARLMAAMGIQVVRMAEFSWMKLESGIGEFHFEWLDEAIALLGQYGIKTVIGTPSAAPPAWIVHETPEILPVDRQGIRRGFGGRHHNCQSNAVYRTHIRRLVSAMSRHYAANTHVIGWQIDNELGNGHDDLCMCDSCKEHFQNWLKNKYKEIDTLNRCWGTEFWSQGYHNFEQIGTPRITVTGENPSAMLDWKLFCSDLIVEFQQYQIDLIREHCPNHFITHNFMGFADKVNYFDLAKSLDFVSHDQYPGGFWEKQSLGGSYVLAATLDFIRGTKKQPFWIMEQQSGITGWQIMGRMPEPGQLAMWAQQSIAHGADAIVFFRWRTCAVGTEQYWHGILPHSGTPGKRYEELKDMIQRITPIMDELEGSMPKNEAAIVFSYKQEYAFRIQPHNPELSYLKQVLTYYKALYDANIPVDFVQDTDDLSGYKVVLAPLQYIMTPEVEDNYFNYVKNGGHLVLTMRTGIKDSNNLCMTDRELPGRLGELVGIEIMDYDCLSDTSVAVEYETKTYRAFMWSDIITLTGARAVANYSSEFYAGTPCVTENVYGQGKAYYVGTEPDEAFMKAIMEFVVYGSGVTPIAKTVEEVEFATRRGKDKEWLFVINHTGVQKNYKLSQQYELVVGEEHGCLEAFGVQIHCRRL